jgi:hypothetical protein
MTDRSPPAASWRHRFFRPLRAETATTGAEIITFPQCRVVRTPPQHQPRPGDRVSFNYQGEPEHFRGTVYSVSIDHTGIYYAICCDDGITRGLMVPL